MKYSNIEVRLHLINRISGLASVIGKDLTDLYIVPEIIKISKDPAWRSRLTLVQSMPDLADKMNKATFDGDIEPILKSFLGDTVTALRNETMECLIKLKNLTFNNIWLERILHEKLKAFHSHQKHQIR